MRTAKHVAGYPRTQQVVRPKLFDWVKFGKCGVVTPVVTCRYQGRLVRFFARPVEHAGFELCLMDFVERDRPMIKLRTFRTFEKLELYCKAMSEDLPLDEVIILAETAET